MKYFDAHSNSIKDIEDWENHIFKSGKREKHWKVGRSAWAIADYMMNRNGEAVINSIISNLLSESVVFEKAIPELEIRFDKYGHGREHDLGIYGSTITSNKKIFIGLEAKVDETFNETISEVYIKAKSKVLSGISTNRAKRIEELLKRNFNQVTPELFDLRYQLLYSTVGTLDAIVNEEKADISILLIMVFKTKLYDEVQGIENYKDYLRFVNAMDSKRIPSSSNIDIRGLNIKGKFLYSIYMNVEDEENIR